MRLADLMISTGSMHEELADRVSELNTLAERVAKVEDLHERLGSKNNAEKNALGFALERSARGDYAGFMACAEKDKWVRRSLRSVPKIIADNVATYAYEHDLADPSDLPALNPPFNDFWVEARFPIDGHMLWSGALFHADGNSEDGWIYTAYGVQSDDQRHVLTSSDPVRFEVTPDGQGKKFDDLWVLSKRTAEDAWDNRKGYLVFLAAISFLNCSNTTQILVRRPLRDRKFGSTRGPKPLLTYRLIHVSNDNRAKAERYYKPSDEGTALHICRGHFRTYTEEAPLFGRLVGTFWVPAHTRGNKKHGVAIRDYAVSPPKEHVK